MSGPTWMERFAWWLSESRIVTWLARQLVRFGQWRARGRQAK